MSVSVKGTASKLEMEILGGIIDPDCPNIEFKNVTFDCKSIKDAAGHIFILTESGARMDGGNDEID